MEKYFDMFINAIAYAGRPIMDAAHYLFNELGPFAWIVFALIPVLAIIGGSNLFKSRTRW